MDITKLKRIKLLLLDVDGVLTDGCIIYDDKSVETKVFNVKDGLGIRLLMQAGVKVGIVTSRSSKALYHRCNNLGISLIFDGVHEKISVLELISEQTDLLVGFSITVADAHKTVIENVDMVTSAKGGAGAVREVCEAILKAQGFWNKILERFL